MKDGYGVYKWANGSIYKGNWIQNKISGCYSNQAQLGSLTDKIAMLVLLKSC
jgi:hypothetical protein